MLFFIFVVKTYKLLTVETSAHELCHITTTF